MKIYAFLENDDLIQEGDEILFDGEWEEINWYEIDKKCIEFTYKKFVESLCIPDNEIIQIRRKLFNNVGEMLNFSQSKFNKFFE